MSSETINWKNLPGENNVSRIVLPNGIIVLCKPDFNSPSIVISGFLHGGSIQDPEDKLGLASFTSYALMRGTTFRTVKQIYNDLESIGASFGFGASVQTTSFGGKSLSEDLPLLLKTLTESLLYPVFPVTQVRKLKTQIISGLQQREQDTGEVASLRFDEVLFPNHPYGRPEDGYVETVQKISQKDLINFHKRTFGPKDMVIVLVGAIENQRANDLVYEALGGWKNMDWQPPPKVPSYSPLSETVEEFIPVEGKYQMDLIMGCHGPARLSDDYLAASIGNNILGQFGMMGRIGNEVREKSGLAYYASTSLNSWMQGGSWEITAGVNPINYKKACEIIINELIRFVDYPVSDEELDDAKSSYIGSLPLSVESNNGVASAILRMERFGLGLNYLQKFPENIEKISKQDILITAQKYINPKKLAIISAGPRSSENI